MYVCVRNPAQPQSASNWMDMNTLTNACSSSNNRVSRLNSQCDVNNRSAANLRSLNVPSVIGQLHIRRLSVYIGLLIYLFLFLPAVSYFSYLCFLVNLNISIKLYKLLLYVCF